MYYPIIIHQYQVYSIDDTITPFTHVSQLGLCEEFYIDETEIKVFSSATIKIEAVFYSGDLLQYLVEAFHVTSRNIKWKITTKRAPKPDTFRNFLIYLFETFPEDEVKNWPIHLLANLVVNTRVLIVVSLVEI